MAEHERMAQRLAIRIFFADPYSPWTGAPVPPQGYRLVGLYAARVERHHPSFEHAPENMS